MHTAFNPLGVIDMAKIFPDFSGKQNYTIDNNKHIAPFDGWLFVAVVPTTNINSNGIFINEIQITTCYRGNNDYTGTMQCQIPIKKGTEFYLSGNWQQQNYSFYYIVPFK